MRLKIFTLMADTAGRFDESELEAFCESNEILSVVEHFFEYAGTVRWALLLSYMDGRERKQRTGQQRTPMTPNLPPELLSLYETLRTWRAARAQDERVPAFQVFSNAELAEICRRAPTTLSQLTELKGVGAEKKKRYGEDVVAIVTQFQADRQRTGTPVDVSNAGGSDDTQ